MIKNVLREVLRYPQEYPVVFLAFLIFCCVVYWEVGHVFPWYILIPTFVLSGTVGIIAIKKIFEPLSERSGNAIIKFFGGPWDN